MPAATLADFLGEEVLDFTHPLAASFLSLELIVQLFIPVINQRTLVSDSLSSSNLFPPATIVLWQLNNYFTHNAYFYWLYYF